MVLCETKLLPSFWIETYHFLFEARRYRLRINFVCMYHPMTQSNANCIHKPHLFSSCYLYRYFFFSHSFIHCRRGFPWSAQILQSERFRSSLCVCHVATWQFFFFSIFSFCFFSVILSSLNAFHFRHGCVKMASSQSNSVDLLLCIHQDANWINGHFHNSCRSEKTAIESFAFVRTRFFYRSFFLFHSSRD